MMLSLYDTTKRAMWILFFLVPVCVQLNAQVKIGDQPTNVSNASLLELQSTNKGFLLPRLTDTLVINALNPPDGMLIYFTPDKSLRIRKHNGWIKVMDNVNAVQSDWNQTTTTAADYIKNKPALTNGTVTSVGLSSSDFSVTGSPVTTSGVIVANLRTSGITAGTYSAVTVNNKGIVTAGTNRSFSIAIRSLNSSFQTSTTKDAEVRYTVTISVTTGASSPQAGTVFLEYSPNGSTWTTIGQVTHQIDAGVMIIAETKQIGGYIPAGYYVRLRTSGTATITYVTGQEILY